MAYMIALYLMMFSAAGVTGNQIINAGNNYLRDGTLPTHENTQPQAQRVKAGRETAVRRERRER